MRIKKYLPIILTIMVTAGGFWGWYHCNAASNNLIRLHVIANSNTIYDQDLKYKVRDRIIKETAPAFRQAKNIKEARDIADQFAERIEAAAYDEIRKQGYNYPVRVVRGDFKFPDKTYTIADAGRITSLTLPAGEYEAVRIIIGEGQGNNWWCVLYPPLCFVDLTQSVPPVALPTATAVEKVENSEIVSATGEDHPSEDFPNVEYRFRLLEMFKSIFK